MGSLANSRWPLYYICNLLKAFSKLLRSCAPCISGYSHVHWKEHRRVTLSILHLPTGSAYPLCLEAGAIFHLISQKACILIEL